MPPKQHQRCLCMFISMDEILSCEQSRAVEGNERISLQRSHLHTVTTPRGQAWHERLIFKSGQCGIIEQAITALVRMACIVEFTGKCKTPLERCIHVTFDDNM
jgi:hypothetical protein